jgi:hypothetical protein
MVPPRATILGVTTSQDCRGSYGILVPEISRAWRISAPALSQGCATH